MCHCIAMETLSLLHIAGVIGNIFRCVQGRVGDVIPGLGIGTSLFGGYYCHREWILQKEHDTSGEVLGRLSKIGL